MHFKHNQENAEKDKRISRRIDSVETGKMFKLFKAFLRAGWASAVSPFFTHTHIHTKNSYSYWDIASTSIWCGLPNPKPELKAIMIQTSFTLNQDPRDDILPNQDCALVPVKTTGPD